MSNSARGFEYRLFGVLRLGTFYGAPSKAAARRGLHLWCRYLVTLREVSAPLVE